MVNWNKHNAELQRADPGTEVTGQFSTRGRIFLHDAQNGFFIILIVLVEKKHTKLIYHMAWLYRYPPLYFHRSYKKYSFF